MATKSYSTAGTLSVDQITDGSVRVWIKGLPKAAYPRKVTWKYKLSTASSYSTWGSTTIAKNATPNDSYYYNVGSYSDQRLIPGKTYNFMVSLTDTEDSKEYCKKYITASTAAATCMVDAYATQDNIIVEISDLKATAYYDRIIETEALRDGEEYWGVVGQTTVKAGSTAPSTIIHKSSSKYQNTNYKIRVTLYTGGLTKYKTVSTSVYVPYKDISIPVIYEATYTAPQQVLSVRWGVLLSQYDTVDDTDFHFCFLRSDGSVVESSTVVTGYSGTTTTQVTIPVQIVDEEVTLFITATCDRSSGTAKSNNRGIVISRYFRWDTEKVAGKEFNLTASEWNRMVNYTNAAHSLYPSHFSELQNALVSSGSTFTATLASKIEPTNQYSNVVASKIESIETALQQALRDAMGL